MPTVTVEVAGLQAAIESLGRLDVVSALREPMQTALYRLQYDMQEYPPARPRQLYIRTGTLGRRWTTSIRQDGDELVGKVGNNVNYAPFVQSRQFQARVHQGRWRTDVQAVNRNAAAIIGDFRAAIARAMR